MLRSYKILILLFILITVLVYFLYDNATKQQEIIVIYPEYIDAKIRPQDSEHKAQYEHLEAHKSITSTMHALDNEPEEPLSVDFLAAARQQFADPISKIIMSITSKEDAQHDQNDKDVDDATQNALNITTVQTKKYNNIAENNTDTGYKYKLHLASVKSETEAVTISKKLKILYPKIFNELTMIVKKNQHGGKYYYILLANGYNSINKAKTACKELLKYKQNCILYIN